MLIPRLGGLRISWNFMKVIGQRMQGSGLNFTVMWIEIDLLGEILRNMQWPERTLRKGDKCSQYHSSSNVGTASVTTTGLSSGT